jgi:hypothetical protein
MKLELYQTIALNRDLPEVHLHQGDIALLIDYVLHPTDGEEGAILEIFNAIGESINIVTVPISSISALQSNDTLSIRRLMTAA